MATFTYKAKTIGGETVSGVLTAESQQAALRTLDDRSLYPIDVREGGKATRSAFGSTGKKKLSLRVISTFYSQLSDLLRAGVPVLRALDVLSRQNSNPALSEILKEVHSDVSGGETLADSMEKHPNAFNELSVAMVRAGESGGFLEDVLARIAVFAEKQDELRNKLIGSMIYPMILLTAGLGVVGFLLGFVVPQMQGFIEDLEDKPWITDALFIVTDAVQQYWPFLLGGVFVGIVGAISVMRSEGGRIMWARMKLKMPMVGKIVTMVSLCRFCRILGTMLNNGVPILQALKISKDSSGNIIMAEEIDKAADNVQKGEPLAVPLGQSGLFPMDIVDMIAVAEESNNLENVLVQIADSNEARTGRQIDLAVRLLEPLMLLLMAGMVLAIAIALLVPILRMSSAAGV